MFMKCADSLREHPASRSDHDSLLTIGRTAPFAITTMSDPIESPETPKKGQLNEKQTKLLAAMTQNTLGKVEYNVSPTEMHDIPRYLGPEPCLTFASSQWEKIALESGYKNVASAKSTYSRLCSQLNSGGSKSSTDKGGNPVSGDSKTPTKVSKRTGKVGSTSAKKPRGKKGAAAAAADAGEDDVEKDEQIKVKGEPEDEDEASAMMSGAL